jgi:beta-mannosidase
MKQFIIKVVFFSLLPLFLWAQNSERDLSSERWNFRKFTEDKWFPATIPGTIHTDLLQNQLIPNPFFGTNEKQLQWIENEDWVYQTEFQISKSELDNENLLLQFEGLDTHAEVYLNGTPILTADNMFRTWKVAVKKYLKIGNNELKIVFRSSVKKGKEASKRLAYTLPGDEKVFTRKAQYQYGWDWGPRLVTAGIWKKVSILFRNSATLTAVTFHQKLLTTEKAELEFTATIYATVAGKLQFSVNDKKEEITLKKGRNSVLLTYDIANPKLWWTNGLGEAHLYDFTITISKGLTVVDSKKMKIGLRTIELIQENDKIGTSFYFKLNGVPVYMKGANYIPPDSFLTRVGASDYKKLIKNSVDANMNMLRVWGGGVYAEDAFYDECDANGILVWQDFMFACAMYPGDASFLKNVKKEVIDNVTRLQHHPSIALWCGNNENDEGWHNWGWQKQYNYAKSDSTEVWNNYKKLFHEVIPKTLDSLLAKNENRYWPSSPSIGWGRKESLVQGDSHYWGVWWGKEPFEMYTKKVGRFMSEYGFQGMPAWSTLQSVSNKDDMNLSSDAIRNHQKHPTGYETINEYMARDYHIPASFEKYIYVSQLLQADGMKTAIEAHRRAKPYCMGTLFWQFNDCWPVTSWSSVDYYGNWKALNYQVKRSFEQVLVSVKEEQNGYKIHVINDDLKSYEGEIELKLIDFSGNVLWEKKQLASVPTNLSIELLEVSKKEFYAFDLKQVVLSVTYISGTKKANSLFYFVKPKELKIQKPSLHINPIDATTIEVSTDVLAKNVFLSSDENVVFSDNFFDVLPNQKRIITVSKPIQKVSSTSLFDTIE